MNISTFVSFEKKFTDAAHRFCAKLQHKSTAVLYCNDQASSIRYRVTTKYYN